MKLATLSALLIALTCSVSSADIADKTNSGEKSQSTEIVNEKKSNLQEEIEKLFQEANNELLGSFPSIDFAKYKYDKIIRDYPATDYSKSAKFMKLSISYADCLSELIIIGKYFKAMEGLQQTLKGLASEEEMDRIMRGGKYFDISEQKEKFKKALESIIKELGKHGSISYKTSSELEKETKEFEGEKGNTTFFVKAYGDLCDKLKEEIRMYTNSEKYLDEHCFVTRGLDEVSIKNESDLKNAYFLRFVLDMQSAVTLTDDFFYVNPLLLNIKIGQMFSALANVQNGLSKIEHAYLGSVHMSYTGDDGESARRRAKERFEKAIEMTYKIEGSEAYSIRSKIEDMKKEFE